MMANNFLSLHECVVRQLLVFVPLGMYVVNLVWRQRAPLLNQWRGFCK